MAFAQLRAETEQGLKQDKLLLAIFLFSILSVLAQASLILTAAGSLPPQLPLFYSKSWGEPMLTKATFIWILPAICALISSLNFSLALFLFSGNKFLVRVLFAFGFIVAVGTLYDTVKIISLLT